MPMCLSVCLFISLLVCSMCLCIYVFMYEKRQEGGINRGKSDEKEAWVGRNEVKNKMARKLGKARIGRNRKKLREHTA